MMRGGVNARHLALRRIMLMIFAVAAALSIFFPDALTQVASFLGIGRGTDLVLYAMIVCFFVFMATTYQRFRNMETSITTLSRRIALDEAAKPWAAGQDVDSHYSDGHSSDSHSSDGHSSDGLRQ